MKFILLINDEIIVGLFFYSGYLIDHHKKTESMPYAHLVYDFPLTG